MGRMPCAPFVWRSWRSVRRASLDHDAEPYRMCFLGYGSRHLVATSAFEFLFHFPIARATLERRLQAETCAESDAALWSQLHYLPEHGYLVPITALNVFGRAAAPDGVLFAELDAARLVAIASDVAAIYATILRTWDQWCLAQLVPLGNAGGDSGADENNNPATAQWSSYMACSTRIADWPLGLLVEAHMQVVTELARLDADGHTAH